MTLKLPIPTNVAYLTVRVVANVNTGSPLFNEDAEKAVQAYLYSGQIVATDLDFEDDIYHVLVRIEGFDSLDQLKSRVQIQRDRLSSGLYGTSEPQFLTPAGR